MKLIIEEGELIPLEEAYMVWGDVSKDEAIETIHKYEAKEIGLMQEEYCPEDWLKREYCKAITFNEYEDSAVYKFSEDKTDYPVWIVRF